MESNPRNYARVREVSPGYQGLSDKEAFSKLKKFGANELNEKKKKSLFRIFFEQFNDLMILILIAATIISAILGDYIEAYAIIAIIILNGVLGFVQEYRTEKTLAALKEMTSPTANVIRKGVKKKILSKELVKGDLILLETGNKVPADAVILEENFLEVDESLLTGESVPVSKKSINTVPQDDEAANVYMGTIVTSGHCSAYVVNTGMNTRMGEIAKMLQNIEEDQTPLQKRLEILGQYIVIACLGICVIVAGLGIYRGENLFLMLLSGISLAVAAVPEGLPAMVTIALALGVGRMAKKNALVKKLPAVETLGCASVICSDKTGTLTQNKMTVRKMYVGGKTYNLKPEGFFQYNEAGSLSYEEIRYCLKIASLCNNAELDGDASGSSTELALLRAAENEGEDVSILRKQYRKLGEIPFDSDKKRMTSIYADKNNHVFCYTKGAPDILINMCCKSYRCSGSVKMDEFDRKSIMKICDQMADDALRVIAITYKEIHGSLKEKLLSGAKIDGNMIGEIEKDFIFAGFAAMIDPPRKEVPTAVKKCKAAGIKPVMITGDHRRTAAAIAREIGILENDDNEHPSKNRDVRHSIHSEIITGEDLDHLKSEEDLQDIVENISVYARVTPKHKLAIVNALKKKNHVVAMTGDGVNDAPAIKEADIGIAMGKSGTDVTKEAAAMILTDDNFASIVCAVEEGRVIYSNIRKFIRYLLACNIGEVLTMFLGMLLRFPVPLLPIQILWVNLVTDGLPGIALSMERSDEDTMRQRPRNAKKGVFSDGLGLKILIRGVLIGITSLGIYIFVTYLTNDINMARSAAFLTLVLTQLIHSFECKSEIKNIFEIDWLSNKFLIVSVTLSLLSMAAVLYIPVLNIIFKTAPLNLNLIIIVFGCSFLVPVISSLFHKKIKS